MQEIINLIKDVGFPIACCVVLFIQQNKLTTTLGELSNTMSVINARLDNIEDTLKREVE